MPAYHFFGFISRMKYIIRWGLMRGTRPENAAEHSHEVAMLSHALCEIANSYYGEKLDSARAALLSLYHDASEIITGDLPTPVKYMNKDIVTAYKKIENDANLRLLGFLPDPLRPAFDGILLKRECDAPLWLRVKAADKLSAYIKCRQELCAGNVEFSKASLSIKESLTGFKLPEVDFFLENFMESFTLTLDEQE